MGRYRWVFLPFAAAVCCSFVAHASIVDDALDANPRLYSLGTTGDGKTYIMENSTLFTWLEAIEFCKGMGMQLATINTQVQADFLSANRGVLGKQGAIKYYYLYGRHSQDVRTFVWATPGNPSVNPFGLQYGGAIYSALTLFVQSPTADPIVYIVGNTVSHNALCQI